MPRTTLLFGAFDRHNLGDLLFPHIITALLPGREFIYAGLAARDMRRYGGHLVRPLAELAQELRNRPLDVIHIGGELLSCDAWQAAVMLQSPPAAAAVIAELDDRPHERRAWAAQQLQLTAAAPYTIARELFPAAVHLVYHAVGGVDLSQREAGLRDEVLHNLRSADFVSVRERITQSQLQATGIDAELVPDPVVLVCELFGPLIEQHGRKGEPAAICKRFPRGYLAVQFSADFGDDATLTQLAAQLQQAARASGHAIVLFRAGAAPWHDDLDLYRRLAARIDAVPIAIFESLNIWDICALIANSRGYCGSSLHGRIVAAAFALPRLNIRRPGEQGHITKQAAYAATWEPAELPAVVGPDAVAAGIARSQSAAPDLL